MDQMGEGLKKMVQAGMGAVAAGVEKTQGTIDKLAKKGEPIYEQARETICETTDKIKKAVQESAVGEMLCCRPRADSIIRDLKALRPEELDQIRKALDAMDTNREKDHSPCPEECCCSKDHRNSPKSNQ